MTKENKINLPINKIANLKIEREEIVYNKKELSNILTESEKLDSTKISNEILTWIIKNVEQFINNQTKVFKLDLILDNESEKVEDMDEVKKLQDLYRAIPEETENNVDEIVVVRKKLDKIAEKASKKMSKNKDLLNDLFKRMAFYYELRGFNKGVPLIQNLEGKVEILKFEYEAFSVGVKIRQPKINADSKELEYNAIKEYVIPEGFTVCLEIAFNQVAPPTSMF